MLRSVLLRAADSDRLHRAVERLPATRSLVRRYVAGTDPDDAIRATRSLVADGLHVSIDRLGEDTTDRASASATVRAYSALLSRIGDEGLAGSTEISVKLSAVGQALHHDGDSIALANARAICAAARDVGTTVTLDMEDHTTTDATLSILRELRTDFPETGAVVQSCLRRTEADCRELAHEGSRVRLCKGAYDEPASVAFRSRREVDRSYVRCLNTLFAGGAYPMVATHDPRLVEIAGAIAARERCDQDRYEYQMLNGIRSEEQRRLVRAGEKVRVYLPYGEDWYGYLVRRMAERPANLMVFLRSVVTSR
ncbi:MAG TPA: proline dehydrogenase family protein [Jiangellaceae bacterium]|nr:proline dehydrogenase family protein [Jiangellaceae bacterium]